MGRPGDDRPRRGQAEDGQARQDARVGRARGRREGQGDGEGEFGRLLRGLARSPRSPGHRDGEGGARLPRPSHPSRARDADGRGPPDAHPAGHRLGHREGTAPGDREPPAPAHGPDVQERMAGRAHQREPGAPRDGAADAGGEPGAGHSDRRRDRTAHGLPERRPGAPDGLPRLSGRGGHAHRRHRSMGLELHRHRRVRGLHHSSREDRAAAGARDPGRAPSVHQGLVGAPEVPAGRRRLPVASGRAQGHLQASPGRQLRRSPSPGPAEGRHHPQRAPQRHAHNLALRLPLVPPCLRQRARRCRGERPARDEADGPLGREGSLALRDGHPRHAPHPPPGPPHGGVAPGPATEAAEATEGKAVALARCRRVDRRVTRT